MSSMQPSSMTPSKTLRPQKKRFWKSLELSSKLLLCNALMIRLLGKFKGREYRLRRQVKLHMRLEWSKWLIKSVITVACWQINPKTGLMKGKKGTLYGLRPSAKTSEEPTKTSTNSLTRSLRKVGSTSTLRRRNRNCWTVIMKSWERQVIEV